MKERTPTRKSAFIFSEKFRRFKTPADFPYEIDRGNIILDFCRSHDLLNEPWMSVVEAREAEREELLAFHTPRYLDALKRTGDGDFQPEFLALGIGSGDCPVFYGLYEYALIAAGATLTAAEALVEEGAAVAFNPAGGLHHAGSEKAEGFCYVNDIVIAVKWLKARKPELKLCYIDIDAHHANGVQDAFYGDDTVLTISMHQTGRTIYPGSGFENETGSGRGKGYTINIPLELKADDEVFKRAFDEVIMPALRAYGADLLITQLGVDMLHSDPLTDLNMTNNCYAHASRSFAGTGLPLLALGGGGYHRTSYVQSNALMWSIMNGIETEDTRALVGGVMIGDPEIEDVGLREARRYTVGSDKKNAIESLENTISLLKRNIPLLGA